MRVETVDGVEQSGVFGPLPRQVFLGAAAQDQYVDAVDVTRQRLHAEHRRAFLQWRELGRRAAGVDADEPHVGILDDGGFDAASEISVASDGDPDVFSHDGLLPVRRCMISVRGEPDGWQG